MYLAPLASQCAPYNAAQRTSLPAVDGGYVGTVEIEVSETSKVTILGLILFKLSSYSIQTKFIFLSKKRNTFLRGIPGSKFFKISTPKCWFS